MDLICKWSDSMSQDFSFTLEREREQRIGSFQGSGFVFGVDNSFISSGWTDRLAIWFSNSETLTQDFSCREMLSRVTTQCPFRVMDSFWRRIKQLRLRSGLRSRSWDWVGVEVESIPNLNPSAIIHHQFRNTDPRFAINSSGFPSTLKSSGVSCFKPWINFNSIVSSINESQMPTSHLWGIARWIISESWEYFKFHNCLWKMNESFDLPTSKQWPRISPMASQHCQIPSVSRVTGWVISGSWIWTWNHSTRREKSKFHKIFLSLLRSTRNITRQTNLVVP